MNMTNSDVFLKMNEGKIKNDQTPASKKWANKRRFRLPVPSLLQCWDQMQGLLTCAEQCGR